MKTASDIPLILDWLGNFAARQGRLLEKIGNVETELLSDDLKSMEIVKPVFICGLPRSGSTLLLEIMAKAPGFAAHCYKDYPFVLAPHFWNVLTTFWPGFGGKEMRERAHQDGMMVNADSPEAFDEMIWMHFFKSLHDMRQVSIMDASLSHPAFEKFYQEHIRKMLYLRDGARFVSKNNYNVMRTGYIQKMFPDALFIVPVRHPRAHVASLVKQHRLFCARQAEDDRARRYMRNCAHFEFGLDMVPLNTGDADAARRVQNRILQGDAVGGYADYWSMVHRHILTLAHHPQVKVVSYEALCRAPADAIRQLNDFACLGMEGDVVDALAQRIQAPSYYKPAFSAAEETAIAEATLPVYAQFGAQFGFSEA